MGTIAGIAAYIGLCAGVLTLFSFADKAASLQGKARARELLNFRWKDTTTRWPSVFVEMFDSIFGKRHFTWKCFWRSCVASLVAVVICTLIYWWLRRPEVPLLATRDLLWYVTSVLIIMVCVNFIPDYISLLETRLILRELSSRDRQWVVLALALKADLLVTFLLYIGGMSIFTVLIDALDPNTGPGYPSFSMIMREAGMAFALEPVPDAAGKATEFSLGVFLYSTYFTSIWVWLYALATFAGKLLLPILSRIEKGKRFFDLDNKPFLALGWLSVVIITVISVVVVIVRVFV